MTFFNLFNKNRVPSDMYMTSSVDQIISPEPYDRLAQPVDNRVRITFTLQTDLEEHGLR